MMYESYLFTLIMPAAILAYINQDLGPDPRYPWITVCWNLGAAIIVTVGGRLADIFARPGHTLHVLGYHQLQDDGEEVQTNLFLVAIIEKILE